MRKKYKIKVTRKLLKQLKPFWQELQKIQGSYNIRSRNYKPQGYGLASLWPKPEEEMVKKTGIENIEFFFCDNEIAGIGNVEKTIRLIHDTEL